MTRDVSSFVGDLVQMAKAMEELPNVQEALRSEQAQSAHLRDVIQRLELQAIDRKNEIDALNAKVRSLEVERDEAQFQALEEQDRTSSFKRFVETMFGQAGNLLNAAKPAEPPVTTTSTESATAQVGAEHTDDFGAKLNEPMPSVEVTQEADGYVADRGIASEDHIDGPMKGRADMGESFAPLTEGQSTSAPSTVESVEGARAMPTEERPQGEGVSVQPDPTHGHGETSSENASSALTPQSDPQPYKGKRYVDIPVFVSYSEWISGGGTEADYYAR